MKIVFDKMKSEKMMLTIVLMCLIIVMASWGPFLSQRDDYSAVKAIREQQLSNEYIAAMFSGQKGSYEQFVKEVQESLPENGSGTYSLMLDESVSYTGGYVGKRPQFDQRVRNTLSEQMLNLNINEFSVTENGLILLNLSAAGESREYERGLIYSSDGVNSLSGLSVTGLSDSWYCYNWQAL